MSKTINYNGKELVVRGGAWLDIMNSCFYEVVDRIKGYDVCREAKYDKDQNLIGEWFALPNRNNE